MKRMLVISDTHSPAQPMSPGCLPGWVLDLSKTVSLVYHAGDFNSEADYAALRSLFGTRLRAVSGNNDRSQGWAERRGLSPFVIDNEIAGLEGVRIGLIHGDQFGEDGSRVSFQKAMGCAEDNGLDVLIFGHIHHPLIANGRRMLICPGSPVSPYNDSDSSVLLLEIDARTIMAEIYDQKRYICRLSAQNRRP